MKMDNDQLVIICVTILAMTALVCMGVNAKDAFLTVTGGLIGYLGRAAIKGG